MMKTDRVHIKGPGTDLRFSIKGIRAIPCGGAHNIPDGEVFTAPVKTSVQGHVSYNAPTIYRLCPEFAPEVDETTAELGISTSSVRKRYGR